MTKSVAKQQVSVIGGETGAMSDSLMPSSPANEALRESLLKQRAAVLSNLSRQGNVGGRRTETAEQPHMGTLNLLPHSPRGAESSSPRNLSWEAGQHYGMGMPPNGQLALPQGPPGPMHHHEGPPGPLFMPGQHMLVPHPSPPPQPPHVITKQTKDERPGFWLEGARRPTERWAIVDCSGLLQGTMQAGGRRMTCQSLCLKTIPKYWQQSPSR